MVQIDRSPYGRDRWMCSIYRSKELIACSIGVSLEAAVALGVQQYRAYMSLVRTSKLAR